MMQNSGMMHSTKKNTLTDIFMIQTVLRHVFAVIAVIGLTLGGTAMAGDPLPAPSGDILLTISGNVSQTNTDEGTAEFDLGMLQNLGQVEFNTTTIWTDGVNTFAGVPLAAVLNRLGITSGNLRATAINDYAIDLPVSEVGDQAPIIAYHLNGAPMSRRDKGPLWIVYPYDSDGKFRSEIIYSRSIWQLDRIVVEN